MGTVRQARRSRLVPLARLMTMALLVAVALSVPSASAATTSRYVSTTGSDANSGSLSHPWRTIARGLTSIRAGQTLYFRGGTYTQNFSGKLAKGTPTARIVVRSYPGERAILKGLISFGAPSYWTIRNLWFTWSSGRYDSHMVKVMGGTGWQFSFNVVWGSRGFDCMLIAGNPHSWSVRGNKIHDCRGGEADIYRSHDLYVNAGVLATGGLIERNLLYNAPHGSNLKIGYGSGTDLATGAANIVVRYNTLYSGVQPLALSGPTLKNIRVYRNIIVRATRPDTTYLVRLYRIINGSNIVVGSNLGYGAQRWCRDVSGGWTCRAINGGGTVFPRNPRFDSTTGAGFHPADSVAVHYGRYAR